LITRVLLSSALLASVLAAAACGSSGGAATSTSSASPSSAAPVAATTSRPATATSSGTAPATGTAAAAAVLVVAQNPTLGAILTDPSGRTLYVFKNDAAGTSNCNGNCATTWPPLAAPSTALTAGPGATGALAALTRGDGNRQVSYKGAPLYRYSGDSAPGDTKGQGIGGVWSAATP
jgi:predicted lipoprotein with Yx(FWY)xxD motif